MNTSRRLFFALWPDQQRQARWAALASEKLPPQMGRLVRPENLHITLLFAGNVSQSQAQCLEQLGDVFEGRAFSLRLDHLGHWRRPQVLWWGASEQPQALLDIVQGLQKGALQCGVEVDPRPYQAHLTLARKVKKAPAQLDFEPEAWPLREFVLVESVSSSDGLRYQVLKSWPLQEKT